MKIQKLLLISFLFTVGLSIQLNTCSVTATNSINQLGTHTFTINRAQSDNSNPANLYTSYFVVITYPYTITQTFNCLNNILAATTCNLQSDLKTIQITSYFTQDYNSADYSSYVGLQFQITINNIMNQEFSGTYDKTIQIYIKDVSNNILEQCNNGGTYPSVLPGQALCNEQIPTALAIINSIVTIKLSVSIANTINSTGSLTIEFPQYWVGDVNQREILPVSSTITCSLTINSVILGGTSCILGTQKITINIGPQSIAMSNNIIIQISGIQSPTSTQPVGSASIKTFNSSGKQLDQCSIATFQNWSPNSVILSTNCMNWSNTVNSSGILRISFILSSPLILNDLVEITVPNQIDASKISQLTDTANNLDSNINLSFKLSGQKITITVNKSFTKTQTTTITIALVSVTAYRSIKPTDSLVVRTYRSIYQIDESTASCTISASPGSINAISIKASDKTISKQTVYAIYFELANGLSSDGYVQIIFPNELTLQINQLNNYLMNSIIYSPVYNTNSQTFTLTNMYGQNIAAGSKISFDVQFVTNQKTSTISNNFTFKSFYSISTEDYLVDQQLAYTMEAFIPGLIDSTTILVDLTNEKITGQSGIYIFKFTNTNALMISGKVLISIPTDIQINPNTPTCKFNTIDTTCKQISSIQISIDIPIAVVNLGSIEIIVTNMFTNCRTLKSVGPFIIQTLDNSNIIDNGSGGSISMTKLSTFDFALSSRDSKQNGVITNFTFKVTFSIIQLNNVYLIIQLPEQLIPKSISCSSTGQLQINISCLLIENNTKIQLTLTCSSCVQIQINVDYYITIKNIQNPISFKQSDAITAYTQYDMNDINSQSSASLVGVYITNTQTNTLSNASVNSSIGQLGTVDELTFQFTLSNLLQSKSQIILTFPSDITGQNCNCKDYVGFPITTSCQQQNSQIIITTTISDTDPILLNLKFTVTSLTTPQTTQSGQFNLKTQIIDSLGSAFEVDQGDIGIFQVKCNPPCKGCLSDKSKCTSCYDSTFTSNSLIGSNIILMLPLNICISDCSTYEGYYLPQDGTQCQICTEDCQSCITTSDNCLSCKTLNYYQNKCQSNCPDNYYALNKVCTNCPNECQLCTNNTICSSCKSGYFYYNNQCKNSCPTLTTVPNSNTNNCDICTNNCATCQNQTSYCLTCLSNYYFYANTCINKCEDGQYPNTIISTNWQCISCPTGCTLCTNSSQCSKCSIGYYFYNNQCLNYCPNLITISNSITNTCDYCTNNCATCQNQIYNCLSCVSNYYYYNYQCYDICTEGTYASKNQSNNWQCLTCPTGCQQCTNSQNCQKCINGYYFYNNFCSTNCPNLSTVPNGLTNNCDNCTNNCLTCQTQTSYCLTCQSNYYFLTNSCISQCPDGTYNTTLSGVLVCSTCPTGCSKCTDTAQCSSCQKNYYYYNDQCYKTCPSNVGVPNNSTNKCDPCDSNCATCLNIATNCQSCSLNLNLYQNVCLESCPDQTYSSNYTCLTCPKQCLLCESAEKCTKCSSSKILYLNDCLDNCPSELYLENNSCVQCRAPCSTCGASPDICVTCQSQSQYPYLYEGKCIQSCSTGYYGDSILAKCMKCESPCSTCKSQTLCLTCLTTTPTTYYQDNSCVESCKSQTAPENGNCISCRLPCSDCLGTPDNCISCLTNFFLLNDQCLTSCNTGMYADLSTNKCLSCVEPCSTCTTNLYCTSCSQLIQPYYLFGSTCVLNCDPGYYKEEQTCKLCTATSTDTVCSSSQDLLASIQSQKYIPVPCTILFLIIVISVIVAKIQKSETFIPGSILGLGGFFEYGSWGILYYLAQLQFGWLHYNLYALIGAIGMNYILNLVNIILYRQQMYKDPQFQIWLSSKKVNQITNIIIISLSFLITFKYSKLLISKYFGFYFFKAKITTVNDLLPFNVISLISIFLCSLPTIVSCTMILYAIDTYDQLYIAAIDSIVITFLIIIALIWDGQKSDEYFIDPIVSASQSKQNLYKLNQQLLNQSNQIESLIQTNKHIDQQDEEGFIVNNDDAQEGAQSNIFYDNIQIKKQYSDISKVFSEQLQTSHLNQVGNLQKNQSQYLPGMYNLNSEVLNLDKYKQLKIQEQFQTKKPDLNQESEQPSVLLSINESRIEYQYDDPQHKKSDNSFERDFDSENQQIIDCCNPQFPDQHDDQLMHSDDDHNNQSEENQIYNIDVDGDEDEGEDDGHDSQQSKQCYEQNQLKSFEQNTPEKSQEKISINQTQAQEIKQQEQQEQDNQNVDQNDQQIQQQNMIDNQITNNQILMTEDQSVENISNQTDQQKLNNNNSPKDEQNYVNQNNIQIDQVQQEEILSQHHSEEQYIDNADNQDNKDDIDNQINVTNRHIQNTEQNQQNIEYMEELENKNQNVNENENDNDNENENQNQNQNQNQYPPPQSGNKLHQKQNSLDYYGHITAEIKIENKNKTYSNYHEEKSLYFSSNHSGQFQESQDYDIQDNLFQEFFDHQSPDQKQDQNVITISQEPSKYTVSKLFHEIEDIEIEPCQPQIQKTIHIISENKESQDLIQRDTHPPIQTLDSDNLKFQFNGNLNNFNQPSSISFHQQFVPNSTKNTRFNNTVQAEEMPVNSFQPRQKKKVISRNQKIIEPQPNYLAQQAYQQQQRTQQATLKVKQGQTINNSKNKAEVDLSHLEEIYLQKIPNNYEKTIQDQMKKKKISSQKQKTKQSPQFNIIDNIETYF